MHRLSGKSELDPVDAIHLVWTYVALDAYRSLGPAPMSVSDLVLGSARSGAMGDAGQLEAGAVIAAESVALGRDAGSHAAVGLGYLVLGWIDVYRGRLDRAVAQLGESDRSLAMAAHPGMRRWALAALGLARALGGDAAGAAETLERLDALGPHPALIFEGTVHRARAWLAFASGSAETAFGHLRRGAAECESAGNVLTALACWHDLARVGQAEAAAIGIDKLLASIPPDKAIEGTLLPAQIAHVRALASGDAAELVACVDRLVELGTTQWAAEAAEAAAVAATRTGDTRAVPGLLSRVSDLRGTMGAAPVAMRAIVDMPLTRREREVAVLAAQGLSSREIGDQLFVAARTVESHLARIYTKLGVHGRAELAQSINASGRAQIPAE